MTDEVKEDGPEQEVNTPEETAEDKAIRLGWKPREEYSGDEKRWVDAEEFLRRGEEILPIVRAEKKKLEELVEKQRSELAEMRKTFGEFKAYHSKTEQRAYKAAMRDLEERQAEAVGRNDLKAVREITKEIATLDKDMKTDDDDNPYASPDHAKLLNSWQGENQWFGSDKVMTAAANAIADDLEAQGVRGAEQLAEVTKRIKAEFPHKFENQRRQAPAAVEGHSAARKQGKSKADLPAEARQFMDRMVKQGLITEAQYLKEYQW